MHVIDNTDPTRVPATEAADARPVRIGSDDGGIDSRSSRSTCRTSGSSSTSCRPR